MSKLNLENYELDDDGGQLTITEKSTGETVTIDGNNLGEVGINKLLQDLDAGNQSITNLKSLSTEEINTVEYVPPEDNVAGINAAQGANTKVKLGEGVYEANDLLQLVDENWILEGSGPSTIIRSQRDADVVQVNGTSKKFKMANLVIDGNKANRTDGRGIYVQRHTANGIFENVYVINTVSHAWDILGAYNIKFDSCKAGYISGSGPDGKGFHVDSVTVDGSTVAPSRLKFDNCYAYYTGAEGFHINNGGDITLNSVEANNCPATGFLFEQPTGLTASGVDAEECKTGIQIGIDFGAFPSGISINGGNLYNCTTGVDVQMATAIDISGIYESGSTTGLVVADRVANNHGVEIYSSEFNGPTQINGDPTLHSLTGGPASRFSDGFGTAIKEDLSAVDGDYVGQQKLHGAPGKMPVAPCVWNGGYWEPIVPINITYTGDGTQNRDLLTSFQFSEITVKAPNGDVNTYKKALEKFAEVGSIFSGELSFNGGSGFRVGDNGTDTHPNKTGATYKVVLK